MGYTGLTKVLHWLTVLALAAQFAVGWLLDVDDSGHGRGRGRGRGGESGRGRGRGGEESSYDVLGDDRLLTLHVALGLAVLGLALARVVNRRLTTLPPWAESLSAGERRLAHGTERALMTLLFLVPLTGLALVVSGEDDLLWLHVGAQIAFFVALAAHLGLVIKQQASGGRLLQRML